jgi:hypothetical protein
MPTVGGEKFPYTKKGMQEAKAWSGITGESVKMEKKYNKGGKVTMRDTRQVLEPSSLEEAAHLRVPGGSAARYTARTKGGDERHITRYIPGEGGKEHRRQVATNSLREAIRMNPDFGDTVSLEHALEFMQPEKNTMWNQLKRKFKFKKGGMVPKGYHT